MIKFTKRLVATGLIASTLGAIYALPTYADEVTPAPETTACTITPVLGSYTDGSDTEWTELEKEADIYWMYSNESTHISFITTGDCPGMSVTYQFYKGSEETTQLEIIENNILRTDEPYMTENSTFTIVATGINAEDSTDTYTGSTDLLVKGVFRDPDEFDPTSGNESTWTAGAEDGVVVTFDRPLATLQSVIVYNKALLEKIKAEGPSGLTEAELAALSYSPVYGTDFTLESGSTIITLTSTFLASLPAAEYVILADFFDDTVTPALYETGSATFVITDATTPDTGAATYTSEPGAKTSGTIALAVVAGVLTSIYAGIKLHDRRKF